MNIVIHNPALAGPDIVRWGDYHFGRSLEKALIAAGATVQQRFWPQWDQPSEADVLLVLRGNRAWLPPPGPKKLLWIVSNSSTVSSEELDRYDLIFAASETLRKRLAMMTKRPVELLRQCTDTSLFHPPAEPVDRQIDQREGIIMVGNSRSVRRPIVDWAARSGIKVDVYGNRWPVVGLGHLVKQDHIDNADLPTLYRRSRISLNDHWADMQHDQIISNRIFDCLACGLPVVSDWFPELEDFCGEAIRYVHDSKHLGQTIDRLQMEYHKALDLADRFARVIAQEHSFDKRARDMLQSAENLPIKRPFPREANKQIKEDGSLSPLGIVLDLPKPFDHTRVLHLHPSPAVSRELATRGFKSYRSAGFGSGPWHIAADKRLSVLGTQEYDLIFVETHGLHAPARLMLAIRIARNMSKSGLVIFHPRGPADMYYFFAARKIRWLRKVVLYLVRKLKETIR
jgi:hypothetical protein